jgi:hypothetical protein
MLCARSGIATGPCWRGGLGCMPRQPAVASRWMPWGTSHQTAACAPGALFSFLLCAPLSPFSLCKLLRQAPWLGHATLMDDTPLLLMQCSTCLDGHSDGLMGTLKRSVLSSATHAGCPAMPTCPELWEARDQAPCMSCTCSACCLSPNGRC